MMLFYTFDNCESPDLGEWVSVVSSARVVGISDKCLSQRNCGSL